MAYPERTPSNNYLPFYLFSFFSLDLHHYKISDGLLWVARLLWDCKVYLCTVLNPPLVALHLSTCQRCQDSGFPPPSVGSGRAGGIEAIGSIQGPNGIERPAQEPMSSCTSTPPDLDLSVQDPQRAPFAMRSLAQFGQTFPTSQTLQEVRVP